MPLQKQLKEFSLGDQGLSLKTDAQMQPDGMLTVAENVAFAQNGVLTATNSPVVTSLGATDLRYATVASVTKEGTCLVGARFGLTRNYDAAQANSTRPGQVDATVLAAVQSFTAGLSQSTNTVAATTSVSHLTYSQLQADNTKVLVCWDELNNPTLATNQNSTVFWGVYDINAGAWFQVPRAIALTSIAFQNAFGTVTPNGMWYPLAMQDGSILVSAQLTQVCQAVKYVVNYTAGTIGSPQALQPNCTASGTPNIYPQPIQDCDNTNSSLVSSSVSLFVIGYPFTSANMALYRTNGATATLVTGAITTTAPTQLRQCRVVLNQPGGTSLFFMDNTEGGKVVNSSTGAAIGTAFGISGATQATTSSGAQITVGTDMVANFYVYVTTTSTATTAQKAVTQSFAWTGTAGGVTSYGSTDGGTPWLGFTACVPVSKIFVAAANLANGASTLRPCAWFCHNGTTYTCHDLFNGQVIGRWGTGLTADKNQVTPVPCFWDLIGYTGSNTPAGATQDTFTFGFLIDSQTYFNPQAAGTAFQTPIQQLQFVKCQWGATQTTELPNGTLTNGLAPLMLGNNTASEDGFSWAPAAPTAALNGAGSLTGTYSYAAHYEFINEFGEILYSRPTFLAASIVATANAINVTVNAADYAPGSGTPTAALGQSVRGRVVISRTLAGGTAYYRLAVFGGGTFADNTTDASLTTNSTLLYTSATGELPNFPCPPATIVAATSTYAAAASVEVPYRLYVSKPFRTGRPAEWNDAQFVDVSPSTGAITGLAVMDDKLVVFKSGAVFYLVGPSFDVTGANASAYFTQPAQVSTYYGCVSPKSVIVTDIGAFYQSPRGLELVGRDLSQKFIGLPLDGPGGVGTIIDSCYIQSQGQVEFLDSTAFSANIQRVWVYDTTSDRWSWKLTSNGFASNPQTGCITCLTGGLQRRWSGTFKVYESATLFDSMRVTTGWVKMSGLQGFARLYRVGVLGTNQSNSTITVTAAYNYDDTVVDTFTFTPASSAYFQFRARASLQKVESVKLTITTNGPLSNAIKLSGISLEYGVNPGLFRMGLTQTAK